MLFVVCCSLFVVRCWVGILSLFSLVPREQGCAIPALGEQGCNQQPTTNHQPPTTNNQQTTTNNQQPTKKGRVSLATLPTIRVHLHITIYHFWGEGSNHLYKDFLKISQSQETRFLLAYPRLTLRKGDCLSLGFWSP